MRGRTLRLSIAVLEAALAAAMAVTLLGCTKPVTGTDSGGADRGATGEPVRIGAIVSLTGTYAGLGIPEKQVIEFEVDRINKAGGIGGRPVEVLIEDDATDEAKAVAAASRLIDQEGVVAIIGATGTGQSMAIRSEIRRAGIPQVSMAGGTIITEQFDPLVFQTPWSNTIVVPFTLERLKADGATRLALITDSGGFGKDGRAVILREADRLGLQVVSDQTFNPGDADMTAQLTKVKSSDADVVVIWNAGKEAATVTKTARELGIAVPLVGGHGNARREFITGAGSASDGFRLAAGKILVPSAYGEQSDAFKVATDFSDRFRAATGEDPSTFAGHAYDALYLIVEAARRVDGEITPEALRDEIEATEGFVGIGGTFSFTERDHNGLGAEDLTMYEVRGGQWALSQ